MGVLGSFWQFLAMCRAREGSRNMEALWLLWAQSMCEPPFTNWAGTRAAQPERLQLQNVL